MKRIGFILSIAAIAIIAFSFTANKGGEEYETLPIGTTAPMLEYQMTSTDGMEYKLEDLSKNNGLLVIFSCNTCPFVIAWEDRYPEISQIAAKTGVGFALINSNEAKREGDDSMDAMREHANEKGYPDIPYLLDRNSELANAFGAKTTPHVFLFDSNMNLVYEGAIDDNHKSKSEVKTAYLNNALMNLKAGKEIDPNDTKAIGCSIKRVKL